MTVLDVLRVLGFVSTDLSFVHQAHAFMRKASFVNAKLIRSGMHAQAGAAFLRAYCNAGRDLPTFYMEKYNLVRVSYPADGKCNEAYCSRQVLYFSSKL